MTRVAALFVLGWVGVATAAEPAATPLPAPQAAEAVDTLLAEELFSSLPPGLPGLAPVTGDQAFLRRVNLDLVGVPPTPAEITAFALDPSAGKRAALVERLLASARFGQNWARYWRDVIFYRRTLDQALRAAGPLENYLTEQFNAGTSWAEITHAFVTATGIVDENGATALIFAQGGDTEEVTAEVSRIFLGVQIQCAQCHDHPTDRWKRAQFHELAAFFPRVAVQPVRGETPADRTFRVIGNDNAPRRARMMGNFQRARLEHTMPDLAHPEAEGTTMTPVFYVTGASLPLGTPDADRRDTLADWITAGTNPWFAKAYVNRIWAELVGEGFYEPIDDLGPDRQCAAPRAIEFLAAQFAANHYDVKWLFRTIMATQAYQRESRPRRTPDGTPFLANVPQRLRSDQIVDTLASAIGLDEMQARARRREGMGGMRYRNNFRFQFAEIFGYDPSDRREEITGSIPQAMLLMNSPFVQAALQGRNPGSPLGGLLRQISNDEDLIVELYLRTLAREPNDQELAICLSHVSDTGDRIAAFEDLLWSLVNRAEFLHRN